MQSISVKTYTDNLYQSSALAALDQYILFEANHISTIVADPKSKQILQMHVITAPEVNFLNLSYDDLKSIQPLKEELIGKFKERKVIISSSACTLVPETLLNVVETDAYYALNQRILPQSQILYCKMHIQQTSCIFNVRNELMKLIRFNMPMVDVYHSSLLFIKAVENIGYTEPANKLHVHVHPGYFELLNLDPALKFYNTFLFENETEIVYFVMAVAEQLQILQSCEVILYGNSILLEDIQYQLAKYVKSVNFGMKPKNINYPQAFNQFADHQFFTESASILCE